MRSRAWCAAVLAAALCFCGAVRGADKGANAAGTAAPMANNAVVAASSGRLPPTFTKVGVDPAQKAKIYSIQATYGPKIAALEIQLATLKAQCEADIRNVLTADQQRRLDDINGAKKAGRMATALKPIDPVAGGGAGAGQAGAVAAGKAPMAGRAAMQAPAIAPAAPANDQLPAAAQIPDAMAK